MLPWPFVSHTYSIGLCIRVRLLRSLPERFKVDIFVKPGSHQSEMAGKLADDPSGSSTYIPYNSQQAIE